MALNISWKNDKILMQILLKTEIVYNFFEKVQPQIGKYTS